MERGNRLRWILKIAVVILLLATLGGGVYFWIQYQIEQDYRLKEPMTLLLIGMDINILTPESHDSTGGVPRTDTMILAIIDPYLNRVSLISIPRDSLVVYPDGVEYRLNEASTYSGGFDLTRKLVAQLTGISVDRMMIVNFESFKHLVNLVGGVEIDVDKRMYYANENGVATINLKKGKQILNGEKALQYVRFRNEPLGDISRVERQRKFLITLMAKLNRPETLFKTGDLMAIARKYTKSDLSKKEMLRLFNFAHKLKSKTGITSYTLPGEFYEAYWKPNPGQTAALIEALRAKKPEDN
jgi:LCP family protein required for cell wall assembly